MIFGGTSTQYYFYIINPDTVIQQDVSCLNPSASIAPDVMTRPLFPLVQALFCYISQPILFEQSFDQKQEQMKQKSNRNLDAHNISSTARFALPNPWLSIKRMTKLAC